VWLLVENGADVANNDYRWWIEGTIWSDELWHGAVVILLAEKEANVIAKDKNGMDGSKKDAARRGYEVEV